MANQKKIQVFSRAFLSQLHDNDFKMDGEFSVSCSVEGHLQDFSDLDSANKFAAEHRRNNPGHKLSVTAVQTS